MPSLRRSVSDPCPMVKPKKASSYSTVSQPSTSARPRVALGHRRASEPAQTSTRRVLADIDWWLVTDSQRPINVPAHDADAFPGDENASVAPSSPSGSESSLDSWMPPTSRASETLEWPGLTLDEPTVPLGTSSLSAAVRETDHDDDDLSFLSSFEKSSTFSFALEGVPLDDDTDSDDDYLNVPSSPRRVPSMFKSKSTLGGVTASSISRRTVSYDSVFDFGIPAFSDPISDTFF